MTPPYDISPQHHNEYCEGRLLLDRFSSLHFAYIFWMSFCCTGLACYSQVYVGVLQYRHFQFLATDYSSKQQRTVHQQPPDASVQYTLLQATIKATSKLLVAENTSRNVNISGHMTSAFSNHVTLAGFICHEVGYTQMPFK